MVPAGGGAADTSLPQSLSSRQASPGPTTMGTQGTAQGRPCPPDTCRLTPWMPPRATGLPRGASHVKTPW